MTHKQSRLSFAATALGAQWGLEKATKYKLPKKAAKEIYTAISLLQQIIDHAERQSPYDQIVRHNKLSF